MQALHVIALRRCAPITAIALLLGGCVGFTLDADEFRRQMTGIGSGERFDAKPPFRDGAASFPERPRAPTSRSHRSGQPPAPPRNPPPTSSTGRSPPLPRT